ICLESTSVAVLLQRDGNVLRLQVLVDPLKTALTTVAGLLDAAEWRRRVGDHPLVAADHADYQRLADAQGTPQVACVEIGDQPELGGVGRGDRLVLAHKRRDRG